MTAENIVKDVGEIYSRVFDHRPVMQGEIHFFVKEFEEKREDREVERLHKLAYHLDELNNTALPDSRHKLETQLPDIQAKLKAATYMCNKVTEKEETWNNDDGLKSQRAARIKDWSAFMDEMCANSAEVDKNFDEQSTTLINQYKELEESLHLVASPYGTPT